MNEWPKPIFIFWIFKEFSDVFLLDVNRKTKQLLRICKRQPLKLEVNLFKYVTYLSIFKFKIYQKGGFLRSDKLFAHSDVSLSGLEQNITISGAFPLLEGRKKIGGNTHIEVNLQSVPLNYFLDSIKQAFGRWNNQFNSKCFEAKMGEIKIGRINWTKILTNG